MTVVAMFLNRGELRPYVLLFWLLGTVVAWFHANGTILCGGISV